MNIMKGMVCGMNKELKFKWHSVFGQLLKPWRLEDAWQKVKQNKGAGGIDGVTLDLYEKNLDSNLADLLSRLKAKEYKPSPVRRKYIPKKNGKLRPLGIPNIEDRIVQQAVVDVVQPKFEEDIFHKWSCGYRPNKGAVDVVQLIMWNIEKGYNHIYDCDIKGFFDNIPHKKLMKILNKYVADGTVLDMVWKWLKAGYMEDGQFHATETGTPQGGVISPLLANVYLNELDWALAEHGARFVRYADDFLVFAKTRESLEEAIQVVKNVLTELGLEISAEKTRIVNFKDDDFDFLGFTFGHWRKYKKDGNPYFTAQPKDSTWKDFRSKIKDRTQKTLTLGTEAWLARVNPVIRGKVNYYLVLYRAIKANETYGLKSRCSIKIFGKQLQAIDGYIRQRLRVAMIHKHPSQKKGHAMKTKWNNEYFARVGLIPSYWLYYKVVTNFTLEDYIRKMQEKQQKHQKRNVERAKEKGQEYYSPDRVRKIKYANSLKTT